MKIPYFEVDAFSSKLFGGNPAGVCLLDQWLPDAVMQDIAAENNFSETAFIMPRGPDFDLRWFTPALEIDLAGHPTLASAFVLFNEGKSSGECIRFHSRSGELAVTRKGDVFEMDFPSRPRSRAQCRKRWFAGWAKSRTLCSRHATTSPCFQRKPRCVRCK